MLKRSNLLLCVAVMLLAHRSAFAVFTAARELLDKPADWYHSTEAATIASNILSFQSPLGGFPKNIDTTGETYGGDPAQIHPTFDNSATTDELRYLARIYIATKDPHYQDAFIKGLDYVLKAQYANGGWPQSYPPGHSNYDQYITFNDNSMYRLMLFVKEIATDNEHYGFVDADHRKACQAAWDRGIDCILKCQIKADGKLTAWCAQHDEEDFSPRPARAFEPVSISGCESAGIVRLLMKVEHPSPEIVNAVDSAVAWLEAVKIQGIKIDDRPQEGTPHGFERFVVEDASAPPLWARFYEIGTNRPIFEDRDSVIKYKLSEIGIERRTGYQWLKNWPQNLLEKDYPKWKAKLAKNAATQPSH
ncbi:MAG TPA: pectate lyase [Tepidisphaeraceae bacterium]|nr:pectate lyase [Tepidisphaeraceae bacterium]